MNKMKNIIRLLMTCCTIIVLTINSGCARETSDHEKPVAVQAGDTGLVLSSGNVRNYTYRVIHTYPHDSRAFTQGLFFSDGYLYEGTGLYGRSSLLKTALQTGEVSKSVQLSSELFGEGTTLCGDKIIQLTWKSRKGFVYSKESLGLQSTFKLFTEGWGITFDGIQLIVSDGTNQLYFLNPETYEKTGQVSVFDNDVPVKNLNELEFVKGKIYANVWRTDIIVMIDPDTGRVTGRVNLKELTKRSGGDTSYKTLNGIAYDQKNDRLFVTGKLWPDIYEIELIPRE
jgi:glutamine cyclotransferase